MLIYSAIALAVCDHQLGGVIEGSTCFYLGERGASCFATCAAVGRIFDIGGAKEQTSNQVCSYWFPALPTTTSWQVNDGECCDYQVRDRTLVARPQAHASRASGFPCCGASCSAGCVTCGPRACTECDRAHRMPRAGEVELSAGWRDADGQSDGDGLQARVRVHLGTAAPQPAASGAAPPARLRQRVRWGRVWKRVLLPWRARSGLLLHVRGGGSHL